LTFAKLLSKSGRISSDCGREYDALTVKGSNASFLFVIFFIPNSTCRTSSLTISSFFFSGFLGFLLGRKVGGIGVLAGSGFSIVGVVGVMIYLARPRDPGVCCDRGFPSSTDRWH